MIITLIGILLGTVVMVFAVSKTSKLHKLLLSGPNAQRWKWLMNMMVFFLVGYGVSVWLVLSRQVEVFQVVTGLVFFVGAFFVLLVVMTAKSDIVRIKNTSDALEMKNRELEKINGELDLFAYRVSHDLRGPIASIQGLVDIMQVSNSKDDNDYCLEKIRASTIKLDGFIQDVLDLSKNSRIEISQEPVDVRAMIMEVHETLRYISQGAEVDFTLLPSEQIIIRTDPVRLKIIITNLLANSFKYQDAQRENPMIQVSCSADDTHFYLSVRDNGIGISSEHQEKIFEMFFRGTDKSVGTGLGLYVVKEIVEKLNGKITVNSTKNDGAEFVVTFPLNR